MCRPTRTIISLIWLISSPGVSNSQSVTWERTVTRDIEIDQKTNARMRTHDSSFIDMLYAGVNKGIIPAYSSIDYTFSSSLKTDDLQAIAGPETDTVTIEDPTTGKTSTKIIRYDSGIHTVHKYRIREEWTFDRPTGTTLIRIVAVAPLLDVYREEIKSVRVLFWCRYVDVAGIISRHKQSDMHPSFLQILKKGYLEADPKTAQQLSPSKNWIGSKERILDIDPIDTGLHHLKYADPDSSLSDIISCRIDKGALSIYDGMGQKMNVAALYTQPDTIELTDPVTGQNVYKLLKHSLLFYGHDPKYKLIENWWFDTNQGIMESRISYVVPFGKNQNDYDGKYPESSYWLKFEDISPILSLYERNHYNNSIAHLLWNDHFSKR